MSKTCVYLNLKDFCPECSIFLPADFFLNEALKVRLLRIGARLERYDFLLYAIFINDNPYLIYSKPLFI